MRTVVNIYRTCAIPFVCLFIKLNIKPNTVVYLGFIISLISSYLIYINQHTIAGFTLFIMYILDHADGQLARKTDQVTILGGYLDVLSDRIRIPIIYFGIFCYFMNIQNYDILIFVLIALSIIMFNELLFYIFSSITLKRYSIFKKILLFEYLGWVNHSVLIIASLFIGKINFYIYFILFFGLSHILFKSIIYCKQLED